MLFNILCALVFEVLDWIAFRSNSLWSWIAVMIFAAPFLVLAGGAIWDGEPLIALFFAGVSLSIIVAKLIAIRQAHSDGLRPGR